MPEAVFEAYTKMYETLFGDDTHTMLSNIPAEPHDAFGSNNPMLRHSGGQIRKAIHTDPAIHQIAKTHPNDHVRAMAASSPLATHDDLVKHAQDHSYFVAREAIRNKNMNIDHVKQLRLHDNDNVSSEAVERYRDHMNPNYDPRDHDGGFIDDQEEKDLQGSKAGQHLSRY